ncbi:MAG: SpoIID/LytB domain-containing protein [Acidobacteriota bacterium]
MIEINREPSIKVGLMSGAQSVRFELLGQFQTKSGETVEAGEYVATLSNGEIVINGAGELTGTTIQFSPVDFAACRFKVFDVVIGINFHWERKETQVFQGALKLIAYSGGLTIINKLPLESYLISVISSEMNANCPPELLRAHAIVSRSWLLAQLENARRIDGEPSTLSGFANEDVQGEVEEIIKWYDRENHASFDVCADDHCQRYQGVTKIFSEEAMNAVQDTRGNVLVYDETICDARYSKSCGGMSEVYRAAWEDKEIAYLTAVYDWLGDKEDYAIPLTDETNAKAWITAEPLAYCNTKSKTLLARILPGFDQETMDFYRWRVGYTQEEIQELLRSRTGIDFGSIISLAAIERGESGRIIKLKITGTKRTVIIGKELEIRRALSRSHLYSSAFVVRVEQNETSAYPDSFELIGAGWGHGVGLCQIGAAVMADAGFNHQQILAHYFKNTELQTLY